MERFIFCFFFSLLSLCAYCQRKVTTINESWRFCKGDIQAASFSHYKDRGWKLLNLPHTWNADDANKMQNYYRGIGWYRKRLWEPIHKGKRYYLYFEGANQLTAVYVNGKFAGNHVGGYTGFGIDITNLLFYDKDSVNVLSVKVDNKYNKNIAPLSGDFTFWGGIYRNVYFVELPPVHFSMNDYGSKGIFVETPQVSAKGGLVHVKSIITNDGNFNQSVKIISLITDAEGKKIQTFSTKTKLIAGKENKIDLLSKKIILPHLWSPEDPYLYHLSTKIVDLKTGNLLDEIVNPLGFRWYGVNTENGFMLNGRPIKLIGACRHQDYLGLGNALSKDLNERDIKLLKEMGANFVRVAHYPQDPAVLDACDKLGLIVWEEIPIVNGITPNSDFYNHCKYNLVEMIRQNYNHPSILIWSYCNEVLLGGNKDKKEYRDSLVKFLKEMEWIVHQEDHSRITSMALHASDIYDQWGVSDIPMTVGWNRYDGLGTGHLRDFTDFLNREKKQHPTRPIFISEYGAGSDARIHNLNPEKCDYSIEFQQRFYEYYLPEILKRKYVVGASLWNLVDFGSALRQESMPHINNKGILYQNRIPKDVYYYYQAMLSKKPVIHIASHDWTLRTGTPDHFSDDFAYQAVKIYSNLREVELFLNHKSLGNHPVNNCNALYHVPFVQGQNLLEARAEVLPGQYIYDDLIIDFKLNPYNLSKYKKTDLQVAVNVGSNCFYIDNQIRIVYQPDQPYRKGSWGYIGDSSNVTSTQQEINATDNGPLFQTGRENMKAYKFDVPDGFYTIDLCFCEPIRPVRKSLYLLDSKDLDQTASRIFNVFINNENIISNFNLAKFCGTLTAVIKTFCVVIAVLTNINSVGHLLIIPPFYI